MVYYDHCSRYVYMSMMMMIVCVSLQQLHVHVHETHMQAVPRNVKTNNPSLLLFEQKQPGRVLMAITTADESI